jgi:hypothetical protein
MWTLVLGLYFTDTRGQLELKVHQTCYKFGMVTREHRYCVPGGELLGRGTKEAKVVTSEGPRPHYIDATSDDS